VWSNDFDKHANTIYTSRFGEEGHYSGNIRGVNPEDIPAHDLVCGGFPCQSFSLAGKRKGFKDTRGTLFFEICRIAEHHRPELLLLENVKGLLSHDGGRTFATILDSLEELGYWWEYQVLNSKNHGVPQNRERVFIVGHLRTGSTRSIFPITENGGLPHKEGKNTQMVQTAQTLKARDYADWDVNFIAGTLTAGGHSGGLHSDMTVVAVQQPNMKVQNQHGRRVKEVGDPMFTLIGREPHGIMEIKRFKYGESQQDRVYYTEGISPSVPASRTDDKLKIFENARIRRLTPIECERLQGFPDNWTIGVSNTNRYKCLGNAVTVNVIEYLGELLKTSINSKSLRIDGVGR